MKKLILSFLFILATAGIGMSQDIPFTSNFPTSPDSPTTLGRFGNNARTVLNGAINSSATTITVVSTAMFPSSGSLTIDNEIIYYTGKTSTTFTGCIRGQESVTGNLRPAASHNNLRPVEQRWTGKAQDVMATATIALEAKLGFTASTPVNGSVLIGNGVGSSIWLPPGSNGNCFIIASGVPTWGTCGGLASVTNDTNVTGSLASNVLTLGWTGTLADGRIASAATWNAKQPAGNYITGLTSDVSASGPGNVASTVNSVGGSSAANIHLAEGLANAATNLNTASQIVK